MKDLKNNLLFKIGVIIALILILLIPASMVKNLIHEREDVQLEAISEVSSKWGNGQTITGPYLSIPYDIYIKQYSAKDSAYKMMKYKKWMHFMPEKLNINGKIDPETRYRGIYQVVVYESKMNISGVFNKIDFKQFEISKDNIHFDKATLNIGISDLKGIEKQISVNWNDNKYLFNSGTSTKDIVINGVNADILLNKDSSNYKFDLELDLKGSQNLFFTPIGKTTDVKMTSNWNSPSFTGTYLPDSREISEDGFSANWNILHLNRKYPQSWLGNKYAVDESVFGTNLRLPVDNYQKSYRVAKYAILFLLLTFLVFFFTEILNNVFIHPIQYLLVGIALIVFYSLLLAFSEHIKFNLAYIVSAILTLFLITGYVWASLKSKKIGLLILGILSIMYIFIFSIIQMEDYALLIGSIGIFIILGLVMYFSRKIDWHEIKLGLETKTKSKKVRLEDESF